jgi:hypothetical protein
MSNSYYKPTEIMPIGNFTYNGVDWTTTKTDLSYKFTYKMNSDFVSSSNAILNYLYPNFGTTSTTIEHYFSLPYGTYNLDINAYQIGYSFTIDYRVSSDARDIALIQVNKSSSGVNFINFFGGSTNNNCSISTVTYTSGTKNYANFSIYTPFQSAQNGIIRIIKTS